MRSGYTVQLSSDLLETLEDRGEEIKRNEAWRPRHKHKSRLAGHQNGAISVPKGAGLMELSVSNYFITNSLWEIR